MDPTWFWSALLLYSFHSRFVCVCECTCVTEDCVGDFELMVLTRGLGLELLGSVLDLWIPYSVMVSLELMDCWNSKGLDESYAHKHSAL